MNYEVARFYKRRAVTSYNPKLRLSERQACSVQTAAFEVVDDLTSSKPAIEYKFVVHHA